MPDTSPELQSQRVPHCPSVPGDIKLSTNTFNQTQEVGVLRGELYGLDAAMSKRSQDAAQLSNWNDLRAKYDEQLCSLLSDVTKGNVKGEEADKRIADARRGIELAQSTLGAGPQPSEAGVKDLLQSIAKNTSETAADARAMSGWQGLRIVSQLLPHLAESSLVPENRKEGLRQLPGLIERARSANSPEQIESLVQEWMKMFPAVSLPAGGEPGSFPQLPTPQNLGCKPGEGLIPCQRRQIQEGQQPFLLRRPSSN